MPEVYSTERGKGGRKRENLVGKTFNRLTVIEMLPYPHVLCRCSCGNLTRQQGNKVKHGWVKSCGCYFNVGKRLKHGGVRDKTLKPTYRSWQLMQQRCYNENDEHYPDYGGRGITVCERWRQSFQIFLEDMGIRPSKDHTIDRVNNNGNYEPGNCRWATRKQQQRNRRTNTVITFGGMSKCLTEWSEITGLSIGVIIWRLKKGWPLEKLLTVPARRGNSHVVATSDRQAN